MVGRSRSAGIGALLLVLAVGGAAEFADAQQSGGLGELAFNQVQVLEARVALLENQVKLLVTENELRKQNAEKTTVTAPFEVLAGDGRSLMVVESDANGAQVVIGAGGGREVVITAGGEGAIEIALAGETQARLFADGERTELTLGQEGGTQAKLLQLGEGGEVKIETGDGQVARLSQDPSGSELSLQDDGGRAAQLVLRPDTAELLMGQFSGGQVRLVETQNGGGLAIGPAGAPVLDLRAGGDGGTLTLGKAGGKVLALKQEGGEGKLTFGTAAAPELTLAQTGQGGQLLMGAGAAPLVQLSSNEGGGELQLGQPDGLRVQLGTRGEEATVQVVGGEDRVWMTAGGELKGLVANTGKGTVALGEADEFWGLRLRAGGDPLAVLGTQGSEPPGLRLYGEGSEAVVTLMGEGPGGRLTMGTGGKDAPVSLGSTGESNFLYLGKEGARHLELLVESDEASVTAVDGDAFARLYVNATDVAVIARNTASSSELGQVNGNWGLNLFEKGGPIVAGLGGLGERGVALRLYEDSQQVGAFGPAPDGTGGTLRLYSGGAGATVSLGAVAGAGVVTVFDSASAPVLAMSGPDPAFAVYNSGGIPVAHLGYGSSGGGNVTAADAGGINVFSAGAASDGGGEVCVVRENNKGACLGIGLPGMGTGQ